MSSLKWSSSSTSYCLKRRTQSADIRARDGSISGPRPDEGGIVFWPLPEGREGDGAVGTQTRSTCSALRRSKPKSSLFLLMRPPLSRLAPVPRDSPALLKNSRLHGPHWHRKRSKGARAVEQSRSVLNPTATPACRTVFPHGSTDVRRGLRPFHKLWPVHLPVAILPTWI